MDSNYWLNRWKHRNTGWHQTEVEPALKTWTEGLKPGRIFVPLCGKSLDLIWLKEQGFQVVGVELSALACEEFFNEAQLPFIKTVNGSFTVYECDSIKLFNGDFFNLSQDHIGKIDAVYDRAALIALPSDIRARYVLHLRELLRNSVGSHHFQFLQVLLTRSPDDKEGPPFSVTIDELSELYQSSFNLESISSETVQTTGPKNSVSTESVILMRRKLV